MPILSEYALTHKPLAVAGTALTLAGLPGLPPLPVVQTLVIFAYAIVSCLVVNEAVKVAMIKWCVHDAGSRKPPPGKNGAWFLLYTWPHLQDYINLT